MSNIRGQLDRLKSPEYKLFCIGLWKTGTTSFGSAMSYLGLDCQWWCCPRTKSGIEFQPGGDLPTNISTEEITDLRSTIEKYNAFSDSPWLCIYKWLEQNYPSAKFVLTTRKTPEQVAVSEFYNHIKFKNPKINEPNFFIDRYNKHNEEVRQYFKDKPGKLIETCWELDGWGKLLEFMEIIPHFPHQNKGIHRK